MNKTTLLIDKIQDRLTSRFPYFSKIIDKRRLDFSTRWEEDFETELTSFFSGDLASLNKAIDGYAEFSLDAMKLQKRFDKEKNYINKSYEEVAKAVYHSERYMFDLYLPGILLSQFLWRHHYQQYIFFKEKFIPLALKLPTTVFFDIGVGTGFYSKEMLRNIPFSIGHGFDISPHSLAHTRIMIEKWRLSHRYFTHQQDINLYSDDLLADAIVSVEVLEHLEEPERFLIDIQKMLRKGGIGYLTAAINAPNADHIYLYRNLNQVEEQIKLAGFKILDCEEFFGYEPKDGETVPSGGVFIVTK